MIASGDNIATTPGKRKHSSAFLGGLTCLLIGYFSFNRSQASPQTYQPARVSVKIFPLSELFLRPFLILIFISHGLPEFSSERLPFSVPIRSHSLKLKEKLKESLTETPNICVGPEEALDCALVLLFLHQLAKSQHLSEVTW